VLVHSCIKVREAASASCSCPGSSCFLCLNRTQGKSRHTHLVSTARKRSQLQLRFLRILISVQAHDPRCFARVETVGRGAIDGVPSPVCLPVPPPISPHSTFAGRVPAALDMSEILSSVARRSRGGSWRSVPLLLASWTGPPRRPLDVVGRCAAGVQVWRQLRAHRFCTMMLASLAPRAPVWVAL